MHPLPQSASAVNLANRRETVQSDANDQNKEFSAGSAERPRN
jgi:hypothetical protein